MGSANGNDSTVPSYIDTVNYNSRQSIMQSSKQSSSTRDTKDKIGVKGNNPIHGQGIKIQGHSFEKVAFTFLDMFLKISTQTRLSLSNCYN